MIPPNTRLRALRSHAERSASFGRSCDAITLPSKILNEID